jgi:hypothetical protein
MQSQSVEQLIVILSLLSFCVSFSGGFMSFMKINGPLNILSNDLIIFKAWAELFGYLNRILVGVISDALHTRRPFLLAGYIPVVLVKLILLMVFTPGFTLATRILIFVVCDVIDYSLNSARDVARDCIIADVIGKNTEQLSKALNIRKAASLIGTISGMLFYTMYDFLLPNSYITLNLIAILFATIGVGVLISYIREDKLHTANKAKINILTIVQPKIIICLCALFVMTFSKPNQVNVIIGVDQAIKRLGTSIQVYRPIIQSIVVPTVYYSFGAIMSLISARLAFRTLLCMFIGITASIAIVHWIAGFATVSSTIILALLYGLHNSIYDTIVVSSMLRTAAIQRISEKGTILSVSNFIMGMGNLLLIALSKYISLNAIWFINYSTLISVISSVIFVLQILV